MLFASDAATASGKIPLGSGIMHGHAYFKSLFVTMQRLHQHDPRITTHKYMRECFR